MHNAVPSTPIVIRALVLMVNVIRAILEYLSLDFHSFVSSPVTAITVSVPLIVLSYRLGAWWSSGKALTLEARVLLKDEELNRKDVEIKTLKEKQTTLSHQLTPIEIETLEVLAAFQVLNPTPPNALPQDFEVEEIAAKLNLQFAEANEIVKKLRRLGYAGSVWDNATTFLDLNCLINEEKPVSITAEGRQFLEQCRKYAAQIGVAQC